MPEYTTKDLVANGIEFSYKSGELGEDGNPIYIKRVANITFSTFAAMKEKAIRSTIIALGTKARDGKLPATGVIACDENGNSFVARKEKIVKELSALSREERMALFQEMMADEAKAAMAEKEAADAKTEPKKEDTKK